ncbi:hypothetical protein G6011_00237 [Alternaria panax]|uniref:Uncharacterized protein n=1 Tax=Alternaria panax TaxID=48097 RepID=A0AAD4IHU5_9PLEO|nr:hypothetical protein G6011_00237 [Alternaria panax]
MSAKPASTVEEADDLTKSLGARPGIILKTNGRELSIKIGVKVRLLAYQLLSIEENPRTCGSE